MRLDPRQILAHLAAGLSARPTVGLATADDSDGAVPFELRQWLVRLRLLDGVPFAYLVPDTELLPEESIRWFYVDRRWTDALVQGALAVGTVNSDDRTQLTARYPAIRDELDQEERNLRRHPGSDRYAGGAGPVSGFLLRSRVVSGWPALHVRAFSVDPAADDASVGPDAPGEIRLLRLERLAPAVLLCLFDGVPTVVHVEEPRQGIQFGFDVGTAADGTVRAELRVRDVTTFEHLPRPPLAVPFRAGGTGVVDIQELERRLATSQYTGARDGLDSSEYALQLIRMPFRQVFGDTEEAPVATVFTATIGYQALISPPPSPSGPPPLVAQAFVAGGP